MVSANNIQMNLSFSVAKNAVPVEDSLDMHNVDNAKTEAARYNVRILCQYTAWAIKIRLENLNEVNNGFTWMKCFSQGCHNMAKSGILKIINGKTVQKMSCLI